MPRESYWITPTRLKGNPNFHKSIRMMEVVSPDFTIKLPQSTIQWLHSNWDKITPENAALCMDYEGYVSYDWTTNIAAAEKVLTACVEKGKDACRRALSDKYTPSGVLSKYIDAVLLPQMASTDLKRSTRYATSRLNLIALLDNKSLQTSQLERIWEGTPKEAKSVVLGDFCDGSNLDIVPDYIFQKMISRTVKNPTEILSYRAIDIYVEAINRGSLKIVKPTKVTVPSSKKITV